MRILWQRSEGRLDQRRDNDYRRQCPRPAQRWRSPTGSTSSPNTSPASRSRPRHEREHPTIPFLGSRGKLCLLGGGREEEGTRPRSGRRRDDPHRTSLGTRQEMDEFRSSIFTVTLRKLLHNLFGNAAAKHDVDGVQAASSANLA